MRVSGKRGDTAATPAGTSAFASTGSVIATPSERSVTVAAARSAASVGLNCTTG